MSCLGMFEYYKHPWAVLSFMITKFLYDIKFNHKNIVADHEDILDANSMQPWPLK